MSHFFVSRAVWNEGSEFYDYVTVADGLSRKQVDRLIKQAGDQAYHLMITEYEDDPECSGMEIDVARSNGEEWPTMHYVE